MRRRKLEQLETRHLLAALPFDMSVFSQEQFDSVGVVASTELGDFVIAEGNQLRGFDLSADLG